MNLLEAMNARHSVRQYTAKPLSETQLQTLTDEINLCNQESGLHIQLVTNEPQAFTGFMARYGKFSGVRNYLAMIGPKGPALAEKCGYYGERLVLLAQQLGLNTCWTAMTYTKIPSAFELKNNEKLCIVIALGYGANQGVPHKSKPASAVMQVEGVAPDWFLQGVNAALLAPTALNQQKFLFTCQNNLVSAKARLGFYTNIDLGIAKYHFEVAAGQQNFQWA